MARSARSVLCLEEPGKLTPDMPFMLALMHLGVVKTRHLLRIESHEPGHRLRRREIR